MGKTMDDDSLDDIDVTGAARSRVVRNGVFEKSCRVFLRLQEQPVATQPLLYKEILLSREALFYSMMVLKKKS